MAQVRGVFGLISGKVGNVVFRNRNGKVFVAACPERRTSPMSALEKKMQMIFGLTGKIARVINSTDLLKYFWRSISAKKFSIYTTIFKNNYGMLDIENLNGIVMITPSEGFELINPSIYPGESNLVIECKALGKRSDFDLNVEKYVVVAGVVVLKNPTIENFPQYEVIAFKSKKYLIYPNDYLSLNLEFAGSERALFESYSIKKVFATFITMDEEERPVQHSETFCSE